MTSRAARKLLRDMKAAFLESTRYAPSPVPGPYESQEPHSWYLVTPDFVGYYDGSIALRLTLRRFQRWHVQ